jgi:hypothetical protein
MPDANPPQGYRYQYAPDGSRSLVKDGPADHRAGAPDGRGGFYAAPEPEASGTTYVNPNSGRVAGLNENTTFAPTAFNKDGGVANAGRAALGYAYSDPSSDISNSYRYGGSREGAEHEFNRQRELAYGYRHLGSIQADLSRANQVGSMQSDLAGGLARAAAGDPSSVAQRQLSAGFDASRAGLASGAASARGGLAGRALARRTASNAAADSRGDEAVASGELMARERMTATGQLSGLAGAMRGSAQSEAFGQAQLGQDSRRVNSEGEMAAIRRGLDVARAANQGEINRQAARRDIMSVQIGENNAQDDARRARAEADQRAVMGGIAAGANAGSRILDGLGRAEQQDNRQSYFQKHPEFRWDK